MRKEGGERRKRGGRKEEREEEEKRREREEEETRRKRRRRRRERTFRKAYLQSEDGFAKKYSRKLPENGPKFRHGSYTANFSSMPQPSTSIFTYFWSTYCHLLDSISLGSIFRNGRKKAGGLALSLFWTTNSDGTLERASTPRICSRGIQPSRLIKSNQWPRMS